METLTGERGTARTRMRRPRWRIREKQSAGLSARVRFGERLLSDRKKDSYAAARIRTAHLGLTLAVVLVLLGVAALVVVGERCGINASQVSQCPRAGTVAAAIPLTAACRGPV